jgi:YD repeat-containing protein
MKKLLSFAFIIATTITASYADNDFKKKAIEQFSKSLAGMPDKDQRIIEFTRIINGYSAAENNKTDVIAQRLIGNRNDNYNAGTWILSDSSRYTYSGNRGSVIKDDGMSNYNSAYDTKYNVGWDGSVPINNFFVTRTRDGNGNILDEIGSNWIAGTYENGSRIQYTYDGNGRPLSSTRQLWQAGAWENEIRREFTYDGNGNLITFTEQNWVAGAWVNISRTATTYDANNNRETETRFTNIGGTLEADYRKLFTYDANGNQLTYTYQDWVAGAWENQFRNVNTYDGNNNQLTYTYQNWLSGAWENQFRNVNTFDNNKITLGETENWISSAWQKQNRTAYTYDASGNQLTSTSYNWDGATWINNSRTIQTYNTNNRQLTNLQQSWNIGTQSWENNGFDFTYTYDTDGNLETFVYRTWSIGVLSSQQRQVLNFNSYRNLDNLITQNWDGAVWVNSSREFRYYETYNAPSGIADAKNTFEFKIYPNPSVTLLNIDYKLKSNEVAVLNVYNITGNRLMSLSSTSAIGDNYHQLNVSELSSGIYFVELTQGGSSTRSRFVKH